MVHRELELIAKDFPDMLSPLGRSGFYSWEEIDEAISNWNDNERYLNDLKNYYQKNVLPNVKKELEEWSLEVEQEHGDYIKELQERYLKNNIDEINKELSVAIERNKETKEIWKKRDNSLRKYYAYHYGEAGVKYTIQDIECVRNVSFTHFLEVKKDFALCPFHEEKTPSFYLKNNYGYCFGCHWKGDIIDFVMQKERLNFPQAIKYLLGR